MRTYRVRTCKPRGKAKGDDSSSQKKIFVPADNTYFPQDRLCTSRYTLLGQVPLIGREEGSKTT